MLTKNQVPLKRLCSKIGDGIHSTPQYVESSDFYFINGNNLKNGKIVLSVNTKNIEKREYEKYKLGLNENTILMSINGTLGNLALYNGEPIILGKSAAYICCNKIDRSFLYYFLQLKSVQKNLWNQATGSTIKNLSLESLKNLVIPTPLIEAQRRIASVLSTLDEKIALNQRINAELEAMAKKLYDYWFVQFDFPDAERRPYKSSGGKMVYSEKLKREIPEGWEVGSLGEWIQNDKSGDWGKAAEEGNYTQEVLCIRGTDLASLNTGGNMKAPIRFILEKNLSKILEPGDLIIEISGGSPTQSTGRLSFVTLETLDRFRNPLICSNFCKTISLKDPRYLFNYVFLWQRLYDHGVFFGFEGKTSGIKNLLFDSFITSFAVEKPPEPLVEKFHGFITPIHSLRQQNIKQSQHLTRLRDWLLPMLMNGQVVVGA